MSKFNIKNTLKITMVLMIILVCGILFINRNEIYTSKVLSTSEYSYLPVEAQNYIKEVYEQTGKIVLTEKNKKANQAYLNPDYVDYLTYSKEEKEEIDVIPSPMIIDYSSRENSKSSLPSSYDLRNVNSNNYTTPNRHQGNLGICWAFTTAGAAESYILRENNSSYNSSSRLISERQIDYATAKNSILDYDNEYLSFKVEPQPDGTWDYRSLGGGGNFYISTVAMADGVSLIDRNSFKAYNDTDYSLMELKDVLNYSKSLYEVNSTTNMPKMNYRESTGNLTDEQAEIRESYINTVKQKIIDNGQAYSSTFVDSTCQHIDSNLNNTIIDVYSCNKDRGHAMGIIGWNDNIEYSYCADNNIHTSNTTNCTNIVRGKGVWILKNSWGNNTPYPYLAYDSLDTTIAFIDEMDSNKNWDNNYVLGSGDYLYYSNVYDFSETKIRNEEVLKKIKFFSESNDATFTIKVFNTTTGTKTYTKEASLPGLITLDIDENVIVTNNSFVQIKGVNQEEHIDKVMLFTSNIDQTPYIDMSNYNNKNINNNTVRLYSDTKNIPSKSTITYKLYNSLNRDVSNQITVTNNLVAENNINTVMSNFNNIYSGTYRLDVVYNNNVIESINIINKVGPTEPAACNITFNANGGTGSMNNIIAYAGETINLPANTFVRENYNFIGWNTKEDGTGTSYSDQTQIINNQVQNLTLYAQWLGEERTITFDPNGGEVSSTSKTVNYGSPYGELPIPTREGYAFNGWKADDTLIESTTIVEDLLYLTADWIEEGYNLIYDGNGGTLNEETSLNVISDSIVTKSVLYGNDETILNNIFTKGEYRFKEWNTAADGTGATYHPDDIIMIDDSNVSEVRLYAIWEIKYTITFNMRSSNLSKPANLTVYPDTQIVLPNVVSNAYYTFVGWYKDYQCTIRFNDTYISNDITLYAKYTKKINNLTISGIVTKYYTGKSIAQTIKIYDGSSSIIRNEDYTLSYSNNKNIGLAYIKINGIGNYSSSITKTFKIIPRAPTLKKVTSPYRRYATVQYSAVAGGVYYQVAYRVKGSVKWKYYNTKTTKITKKGFASKKYYFYKVRAYKKVNGVAYCSPWSSTKYVKIK